MNAFGSSRLQGIYKFSKYNRDNSLFKKKTSFWDSFVLYMPFIYLCKAKKIQP